MAELHTYDPREIKAAFKNIEIRGFAKGTFISVKRSSPTWSMQVSADGEVTRVRSRDKTGTIQFTLVAGSACNKQLALVMKSDEQNADGIGVVSVRDQNGNDKHISEKAWLVQPPEVDYAEDAGVRVWMIQCTDLDTFSGGSVV